MQGAKRFELFFYCSVLFLVGSVLWLLTLVNDPRQDLNAWMSLLAALTFVIGSVGFTIVPFMSEHQPLYRAWPLGDGVPRVGLRRT